MPKISVELTGPFSRDELLARVRLSLAHEKVDVEVTAPESTLIAGDLIVDRARHRVTRGGEEIPLTLTEFNLLAFLVERKNIAVTRAEILDAVWGGTEAGFTNVVDVYVNYLRRKIEREGAPRLLKTVRGVGYLLEDSTT